MANRVNVLNPARFQNDIPESVDKEMTIYISRGDIYGVLTGLDSVKLGQAYLSAATVITSLDCKSVKMAAASTNKPNNDPEVAIYIAKAGFATILAAAKPMTTQNFEYVGKRS